MIHKKDGLKNCALQSLEKKVEKHQEKVEKHKEKVNKLMEMIREMKRLLYSLVSMVD